MFSWYPLHFTWGNYSVLDPCSVATVFPIAISDYFVDAAAVQPPLALAR